MTAALSPFAALQQTQDERTPQRHDRSRPLRNRPGLWLWGGAIVHIPLALVLDASTLAATAHAWAAVLSALLIAAVARNVRWHIAAMAYVAGAEVTWRSTDARFFYEGAKYALACAALLLLITRVRRVRHGALPITFVVLLVPAAIATVVEMGVEAREPLSFNLSGPLSLAVLALVFRQLRATWADVRTILIAVIVPLTMIATLAARGVASLAREEFGSESNIVAAGGFGPNQVAVALGFGALACLVVAVRQRDLLCSTGGSLLGLWFMAQCVLTLSRGGALSAIAAGGTFVLVEIIVRRGRARSFLAAVVAIAALLVLVERLNDITAGSIDARFGESSSSGRASIASRELKLFEDNILLGVGAGQARVLTGRTAHTEFTRLLAEHGSLGAGAALILVALPVRAIARGVRERQSGISMMAAYAVFSLSVMTHAAMRLAVLSFAFGLTALVVTRPTSLTEEGRRKISGVNEQSGRR